MSGTGIKQLELLQHVPSAAFLATSLFLTCFPTFICVQFGHLFARGENREAAIRAMVVALRDVRVRGEVHTIIDYAVDMLQSADFVNNQIHTGWLDARIAAKIKAGRPPWHLCVVGGAVVRAYEAISSKAAEYLGFLSKGQLPPPDISLINFQDDLVIEGVKYRVKVLRRGPTTFNVAVNDSNVDVVARKLGDGGFLLQVRWDACAECDVGRTSLSVCVAV